ncbi:two component, sigma54 specific, transcriptional regulator, Fis family [Candidatus Koribacter versatilis Ellin345]|uniref:Two component, sigma54 specific, transcriptional regulator, Fis family n=1 Tax=Koribacter versatilis (strain Ellin345) TaxID=204669 RepID=Q1IUH0_KORVE|nr:sigma-54 dependent transcriptional regulator [Candidatus Koribacter versatilis]ABF39480.1 two component, sigma54 specific, transcriptional regulator, Fis family [Candidatus Koribacter versatilis Ellin345]
MPKPSLHIVVVDDDPGTCVYIESVFAELGHTCKSFVRPEAAEEYILTHPVDLAIVDVYLGSTTGVEVLRRCRVHRPKLYAVIITGQISLEMAARSIAEGAVDYIQKPIDIDALLNIAERALEHKERSGETPAEQEESESKIVGSSPSMLEVYKLIARVAPSNANVLITGASGTGKELVARAIHEHSRRAEMPFTPVNCGSFAETLLESELFGHEKGAFTGADSVRKGLIESTQGGTLFLDEITETSLGFQVKLLRVLQEQQLRRIGSNKIIPIDVRILAATNRDVPSLIREGKFREDLYYRLAVVQIKIPMLAERQSDIPSLVTHFLRQFNERNQARVSIEQSAVELLQKRSWPGNVRELENTIYRLAIFASTGRITGADVEREQESQKNGPKAEPVSAPDRLVEMERHQILRILKDVHGNKSEAARRLGIERKTLYKKAVRLGITLDASEYQ